MSLSSQAFSHGHKRFRTVCVCVRVFPEFIWGLLLFVFWTKSLWFDHEKEYALTICKGRSWF